MAGVLMLVVEVAEMRLVVEKETEDEEEEEEREGAVVEGRRHFYHHFFWFRDLGWKDRSDSIPFH